MAARLLCALVLVVCVQALQGVAPACRIGPNYWCKNPVIAKLCNVADQCTARRTKWPVEVAVYYLSHNKTSEDFINSQLVPAYKKLGDMMNIKMVPYGNARAQFMLGRWEFYCVDGSDVCVGNVLQACAISKLRDVPVYLPFIGCMASLPEKMKYVERANVCANKTAIPKLKEILECTFSTEGGDLSHDMQLKTEDQMVLFMKFPFVTINEYHTDEINKQAEKDLVKLVCDTYVSHSKPAVCQGK